MPFSLPVSLPHALGPSGMSSNRPQGAGPLWRGETAGAVEALHSTASRRLPRWSALDDLGITEAWIVAPVEAAYPLRAGGQKPSGEVAPATQGW
jgi:hypothetical protein